MERGQTNPRSHEPAASISPVHRQGQQCLTAPHMGRAKKTPLPSPELCQREADRFVREVAAHKVTRSGSISLPTQPQPRVLSQSLHGASSGFPAPLPPVTVCWAPDKEQHWGVCCGLLSVVAEPEEAGGHCVCVCTPGSGSARAEELKTRVEHSATSCRAQGAQGHRSGPVGGWYTSTTLPGSSPDIPSAGQGDEPCHLPQGTQLQSALTLPKAWFHRPASS